MQLGAFSVSLAVRDLSASLAFYEKLGFSEFAGEADQGWLILKNGAVTIGLFQDMFEKNILTFNPGWNADAEKLDGFTDVRDLQKRLKSAGIDVQNEVEESGSGPGSFTITDPDGNTILFDQHV